MKKIIFLFALVASIGTMFASDTQVDGIWYDFDSSSKTASVTFRGSYYSSYSNEYTNSVVIPASVVYNFMIYSVTSIGDNAFSGCTSLTSVTIPNSVTSIGDYAFQNCSGLTSIEIPNSVTSIGDKAFYNCSGLTSIEIPNSVTSIGDKAFYNCSGLTSITIPNSVTSIGMYAFDNCSGLTSVTIGNSVISIGDYAFQNCSGLTSVTIPNSVTSIGVSAFSGCTSLTSVTIPNSVTSIGVSAFSGCTSLTSVIWNAENCADFGYNTAPFNNIRSQITSFTFSNEVEHIPAYLCNGMSSLTSIEIPNSVTSIGDYAFYYCSGLTGELVIPNSVTCIGNKAFFYCSSLTSVTIGNSVTSIGERAFSNCSALEDVTIGIGVIELGKSVFTNSANIKRVQWNAINYRQTKPDADSNCFPFYASRNSITSFIFGDNVTYIPAYLLKDFSLLDSIAIPASVTEIAQYAFANNSLAEIICLAETPPTLGNDAFYGSNAQIYVPCGTLDAYKTAWSEYASQIKYEPLKYHITGNVNIEGSGSVQLPQNKCEDVITASPNYGYHFVRWNDGNTDNPRTIVLASDTTFTAEFAKNTYSISTTSTNPEWGTTAGGKSALYLDEVEILATANYGYHFVKWNDNNTSNPRTVSVTEDKTYTATFAKNVYSITKNAEHGTITGNSSAEYLDYVTLTVTPDYGYHFTQWSDGLKDNPRIFQITKDTTFTAEFAYDRVGTCGKDMALVWSYDPNSKVLTIGNAGEFTENMQFGAEAPTEMEELVIGNNVTAIGENAFAGISTLKKVTIGESVKTIHNNAFYNCVNLETIFNYRQTPTNAYSTAFDGVDKFECKLYVLPSSIDMYKAAAVWRDFYYTYAIGAVETTVTTNDVTVEPQDNAATVTWPTSNNAATYTIEITKDGVVFCTLIFNGNGQLTGIAFAPGKNGTRQAPTAVMTSNGGLRFTVTGLDSGTNYHLTLDAKNELDEVVVSYDVDFETTGQSDIPTGMEETGAEIIPRKILHNGQVYIQRGDKTYTLDGMEVK